MQTRFFLFALAVAAALTLSCKKDGPTGGKNGSQGKKGGPIVEVNGSIRFYAALSEDNSVTARVLPSKDLSEYKLLVNGKEYSLSRNADGDYYVDVPAHYSQAYNAVLVDKDSKAWYGRTVSEQIAVPFSQFCATTTASLKSYPRYSAYTKETGNLLTFGDHLAMLDLRISGSGQLASVKVSAPGGEILSGEASYDFAKKTFTLQEGFDHTVVNCMEGGGVSMTAGGVSIPVYLAPGDYSKGLEITLCSKDHKMMRKTLPAFSLTAGEIRNENLMWAPAGDLLWYEGFDNFVWGGDIIGGEESFGYAPDNATSSGSMIERDGYTQALTRVTYNTPGNGFVQPDYWPDCEYKNVGAVHSVKDSYIESRNLADWTYLFRSQEFHGVLAVGTTSGTNRGIIQFSPCTSLRGMSDIRVNFKLCFQNGITDDLLIRVVNAGHISTVKVDGRAIPQNAEYYQRTASGYIGHDRVSIPSSLAEPKTWHNVEITITSAADVTRLYMAGASNESGVHGFWLDDIDVRTIAGTAKKGTLRLLYMNIQNGMWADQGNNFDNFVAWVNRYDPDICVWCESESIYKTGSDSYLSTSEKEQLLPTKWPNLAARYGHNNYQRSYRRDAYPQAITSKYAISKVQSFAGTNDLPIVHGAGHFQITVGGRKLNIVTCHLYPKGSESYKPSVYPTAHEYREYEMNTIINQTINNASYASEQDWILVGDFNAVSRLDDGVYGYGAGDKRYLAQNVILDKTNLKDIIATWYPAPQFVQSTYGVDRRDFVYLSPALVQNVVRAVTFTDSFTPGTKTGISNFSIPSDHRPFIVDFNI